MTVDRIIKFENFQLASLPLVRLFLKEGKAEGPHYKTKIVLKEPITLIFEESTQRVVVFRSKQPNPFVRLATALNSHSTTKDQQTVDDLIEDPYWDELPKFEPKINFSVSKNHLTLFAEVEGRDLISDFLTRDLLELSMMHELIAYKHGAPIGQLGVTIKDCFIDINTSLPIVKSAESGDEPINIYNNAISAPLCSTDLNRWRQEAELVLKPDSSVFGYREPWMRRVALPMIMTIRCLRKEDARWKIFVNDINDDPWREAAKTWISQTKDIPKEMMKP